MYEISEHPIGNILANESAVNSDRAKRASTLRWLSCGHVDDGKSTLMGALWHAFAAVPQDVLASATDSHGNLDYAALLDGLEDEQAQGITIDVAWRFARYNNAHWILADTPGHQQYTRNMAVAASYSQGALLVIDAQHGVREQTVRHAAILDHFAVPYRVIFINKMDTVEYSQRRFEQLAAEIEAIQTPSRYKKLVIIPGAALYADGVAKHSSKFSWYKGQTVLEALQDIEPQKETGENATLFIQTVARTVAPGRVYLGSLCGGTLSLGQTLQVAGSKLEAKVAKIWRAGEEVASASDGDAIALALDRELDLTRGSVLTKESLSLQTGDRFTADLVWIDGNFPGIEEWHGVLKIQHLETHCVVRFKNSDAVSMNANIETASLISCKVNQTPSRFNTFLLIDEESSKTMAIGYVSGVPDENPDLVFNI